MDTPAPSEATGENLATETSRNEIGEDLQKQSKRESLAPQSLPTRHSSLPKTRGRAGSSKSSKSSSESKQDSPITENHKSMGVGTSISAEDTPPTPPPKNDALRIAPRSMPGSSAPKKGGFFSSFMTDLLSCCSPGKKHDDKSGTGRQARRRRVDNESIEMEPPKQDDENRTTSTTGVPLSDGEVPPVSIKKRDTPEETKPSVTIAPDVVTEKESTPRIVTPPLGPLPEDDDEEHVTMATDNEREREKELRNSMQIQAPFPPTSDEQTDALVVSPTPQISLQQTTESEDSEEDEEPLEVIRTPIVDEPQPRVSLSHMV
jgi:hypothetical protein